MTRALLALAGLIGWRLIDHHVQTANRKATR